MNPNTDQQQLIQNHDGIYCVDAGPGTGKTYTLTRRYASIVAEQDCSPQDILMATFTETAAETMRDSIIERTDAHPGVIGQAPIGTFHSHCHRLLEQDGHSVPQHLGIETELDGFEVLDDTIIKQRRFEQFYHAFRDRHPEYDQFYRIIDDPQTLHSLIEAMACKGVIPEATGWYRGTGSVLDGDWEAFKERFEAVNTPNDGRNGPKNSDLKNWLLSYGDGLYEPDAPSREQLRAGENTVPDRFAGATYKTERDRLTAFIHDLYHEYLTHCIETGQLSYAFLLVLAYVQLIEDPAVRTRWTFEYVMLDEFQDTNEVQFKLALLMSETGNIAVVGDWKQSIFGFQYAAVENIRRFETRLETYHTELAEATQMPYGIEDVTRIRLQTNYRSGQQIIDIAEQSLGMAATESDTSSDMKEEATSLQADRDPDHTAVRKFSCEGEQETVLALVQDLVDSPEHTYGGEPLSYEDIAVLTRKKAFGRELAKQAESYGIPAGFRGDMELFSTDPALLVLAWLRILGGGDRKRGWAVVLEEAGYPRAVIEDSLDSEDYPADMMAFRSELSQEDSVGAIAERVFERYGIDSDIAACVTAELEQIVEEHAFDPASLVSYLTECIDEDVKRSIERPQAEDTLTIETIHSAKGKEYPIVIVADVTQGSFPSYRSGSAPIIFDDTLGLRQRDLYRDENEPYIYTNWRAEVLQTVMRGRYDEERRLFYVAMTRAENQLYITAEKGNESKFFSEVPVEPEEYGNEPEERSGEEPTYASLSLPEIDTERPTKVSAHDLMGEIETAPEGRGITFGNRVHRFAEQYIAGDPIEGGDELDFDHVRELIDDLEGACRPEQPVLLPLREEGYNTVIEGVVDLVHETDTTIEIIDFKTDRTRANIDEYRKQLSVYYHVYSDRFPNKNISINVFYTHEGDKVTLEPMTLSELGSHLNQ